MPATISHLLYRYSRNELLYLESAIRTIFPVYRQRFAKTSGTLGGRGDRSDGRDLLSYRNMSPTTFVINQLNSP
jgi:hypothetical protein